MANKESKWLQTRMVIAFICATGIMELYISRTNLSIAIIAMAKIVSSGDSSSSNSSVKLPYCLREDGATLLGTDSLSNFTLNDELFTGNISFNVSTQEPIVETSQITMTTLERGNLLSAFFYSYGLSGIFGGRLAEVYGTKKVFGIAVLVDALGNFLIPIAAKTSYGFLFFIRFTMGIFQGACYPSLHSLASKWIPPNEQPTFVSFVYPANSFGMIFSLTLFGIIISKWGWEASFYVSGSISLIWLVFWIYFVYDTPEEHPRISEEEKQFIMASKKVKANATKPKKVPWKEMVTSVPLWAISIAHAGAMIGLFFLLTQLPTYMNSIIGVNIRNNGFLSSLPFLARFISGNVFGWISKYALEKNYVRKITMKRILTFIGFGLPAVALLFVGYVGCNTLATISLFIIGMTFNSATLAGYCCNHLDLTTNFSGTAFGFSSMVASLYAMLGPVIVGALTPEETMAEWRIVYWFVFANYLITGAVYCVFLSTTRQSWDEEVEEEDVTEELKGQSIPNEVLANT